MNFPDRSFGGEEQKKRLEEKKEQLQKEKKRIQVQTAEEIKQFVKKFASRHTQPFLTAQLAPDVIPMAQFFRKLICFRYNQMTKNQQEISQIEKEIEKNQLQRQSILSSRVPSEAFIMKGKLLSPLKSHKVVQLFGSKVQHDSGFLLYQKGLKMQSLLRKMSPVRAAAAGRVVFSGVVARYGKVLIIDHGHDVVSLCAHLTNFKKKQNQKVRAGEVIGQIDSKHALYFEVRIQNQPVNPLEWMQKKEIS
jgi:septal ring factor EnvC (AmiA/AmiB activator)